MQLPVTVTGLPERMAYESQAMSDTGLLWYINASCFHPHGLALGIDSETGHWSLHAAKGGEPFVFADDETTRWKFQAVQQLFAEVRTHGSMPHGSVAHRGVPENTCEETG